MTKYIDTLLLNKKSFTFKSRNYLTKLGVFFVKAIDWFISFSLKGCIKIFPKIDWWIVQLLHGNSNILKYSRWNFFIKRLRGTHKIIIFKLHTQYKEKTTHSYYKWQKMIAKSIVQYANIIIMNCNEHPMMKWTFSLNLKI